MRARPTLPNHSTDLLPRDGLRFAVTHVFAPMLGFVVLLLAMRWSSGDQWLADRLYAMQGGQWALRDAFVTQTLVHRFGRYVGIALWIGVLVAWLVARRRARWAPLRAPLTYLAVAVALSVLCVAWVKSWSNMDCPWDLTRYGGLRPFVGLWDVRPVGLERGACFPAGHAGGGYAWLSLYFFLGAVRPRWRWAGLAAGIVLGLVFGIAQQLRGAHFASHDIASAGICWAVAIATWQLFRPSLVRSRWMAAGIDSRETKA
ncbi:phosphatase PAP2 family protein [Lysobacter auxotrophicus]|uniref:Phosphatase PAP2 family protein n=1 Tax=Lysobacter auxotrophicus TaxID=2992573 RepID=A0ABM8DCE4_9GAMM|nr:phosphatase PAP2 family protein [Lysobacter auxotrophicus]BDU16188.1 phosphatase PAP2 family protein [Lysobacter auxotrophicus]